MTVKFRLPRLVHDYIDSELAIVRTRLLTGSFFLSMKVVHHCHPSGSRLHSINTFTFVLHRVYIRVITSSLDDLQLGSFFDRLSLSCLQAGLELTILLPQPPDCWDHSTSYSAGET